MRGRFPIVVAIVFVGCDAAEAPAPAEPPQPTAARVEIPQDSANPASAEEPLRLPPRVRVPEDPSPAVAPPAPDSVDAAPEDWEWPSC